MSPHRGDLAGAIGVTILVLTVGLSAFAFGSVESWATAWLGFAALAAFTAAAWNVPRVRLLSRPARGLLFPVGFLLVWAVIQIAPLPRGVIRVLSPRTAALYEATVPPGGGAQMPRWLAGAPLPRGPADRGDRLVGHTLSIHPHATRRAILSWITAVLLLIASAYAAREPLARYRLLWGICFWGGAMGVVGLLQSVWWNDRLLWFRAIPPDSKPLGPFVNPNHYAGFVEMCGLSVLGLFLAVLAHQTGRLDLRGVRGALTDRSWALPRILVLGTLAVTTWAGLAVSGSRGGWLAFGAGLLFLGFARRLRAFVPVLAAAVVLLGVAIGLASWIGPTRDGLYEVPFVSSGTDPSGALRLDTYSRTLRILNDHPLAGTGLGTFQWAYASYQRQGEWGNWDQAHNDYLQLLSETGWIGAILAGWVLVAFVRKVLVPALRAGVPEPRWTTAAVASAVFAMLAHSIVDFNLQIPSNAALFAVLTGILVAAASDRVAAEGEAGPA